MRQRAVHRKKPFSIGMRQRRGASQKTAEVRFNMLARGWLAYPVTPAPIEAALPSTTASADDNPYYIRGATSRRICGGYS